MTPRINLPLPLRVVWAILELWGATYMHCDAFLVSDPRVLAAEALIDRLTMSDPDLHDHCYATAILSAQILGALGKADNVCAVGFIIGLLHDAGVPQAGEHPKNGLPSEWQVYEMRARRETFAIVREVPALAPFAGFAANVHMEMGSSLITKAVLVADQYDVLTRSWAGESPHCGDAEALVALQRAASWKYDARVVRALLRVNAEQAA